MFKILYLKIKYFFSKTIFQINILIVITLFRFLVTTFQKSGLLHSSLTKDALIIKVTSTIRRVQ